MASQSLKLIEQNVEGLFNCDYFHGELSKDDATEILNEAVANDGESEVKMIFYLETDPWGHDIGKKRFAIMRAIRIKGPDDIQPEFLFTAMIKTQFWNSEFGIIREGDVVRKNPFSLEVLAAVKVASSGFNLETQGLPRRIEEEVKKYQEIPGLAIALTSDKTEVVANYSLLFEFHQ